MTTEQARKIFDQAIDKVTDPDQIARIEIIREYFCNPDFRKFVQDKTWEINNG